MAGRRRVRSERIHDPDSIASHRHRGGAVCLKREVGSRVVSRNGVLVSSWWEREHLVSGGHGERDLFLVSLHFHFHFWQPPLLRRVFYPPSRSPLPVTSRSLPLSFSSPSVYALLQPPLLPLASRTCEIHRAGFPCDAVSPASSLQPRYYLDFHRPEMPSFSAPLFVVRPSSSLSSLGHARSSLPRDFCTARKRIPLSPFFFSPHACTSIKDEIDGTNFPVNRG